MISNTLNLQHFGKTEAKNFYFVFMRERPAGLYEE